MQCPVAGLAAFDSDAATAGVCVERADNTVQLASSGTCGHFHIAGRGLRKVNAAATGTSRESAGNALGADAAATRTRRRRRADIGQRYRAGTRMGIDRSLDIADFHRA